MNHFYLDFNFVFKPSQEIIYFILLIFNEQYQIYLPPLIKFFFTPKRKFKLAMVDYYFIITFISKMYQENVYTAKLKAIYNGANHS